MNKCSKPEHIWDILATGTPHKPCAVYQNKCRNPNTIPGMPVETT